MAAKALKYVSATKRVGKPMNKKKKAKKSKTSERKVDTKLSNAVSTALKTNTENTEEVIKMQKVEGPKAKIHRPAKPDKKWFAISTEGSTSKVVCSGTQLQCLQYIASYVQSNGESTTNMFLANGLKILGY